MKNFHFIVGLVLVAMFTVTQSTICGENELLELECLYFHMPDEYYYSHAVARLFLTTFPNMAYCTAFRVDKYLMLTNNHCISTQDQVEDTEVRFLHKNEDCYDKGLFESCIELKGDKLIVTDKSLDFTLFSIKEEDSDDEELFNQIPILELEKFNKWDKWETISTAFGTPIYIPQHPGGKPLKVAIRDDSKGKEECKINSPVYKSVLGFNCDCQKGSSGSPVINRNTNKVAAILFGGDDDCSRYANEAKRMPEIYPLISQHIHENAGSPPLSCAWLYQHANYEGFKDEICLGDDVQAVGLTFTNHKNQYSSIKVGLDVQARLYKNENYDGLVKTANKNIEDFGPHGYNDMISSVKIEVSLSPLIFHYCIYLFQYPGFMGYKDMVCYGNDIADVNTSFPGHNDSYSSVLVGGKVKADLFKHANFVDKVATVNSIDALGTNLLSNMVFSNLGIDDMISSIRIHLV